MTHIDAHWEQLNFRGRNDDVGLNSATFTYALNTDWSQLVDVPFRVRYEVEEDAGASNPTGPPASIQYQLNGGGYLVVAGSTTVVIPANSSQFTNGDATTNVISGSPLTFVAGTGATDGVAGANDMSNNHTEMEFCIQIVGADVNNGDTIDLRINSMDVYTQLPTVTVNKPAGAGTKSRLLLLGVGT